MLVALLEVIRVGQARSRKSGVHLPPDTRSRSRRTYPGALLLQGAALERVHGQRPHRALHRAHRADHAGPAEAPPGPELRRIGSSAVHDEIDGSAPSPDKFVAMLARAPIVDRPP